MARASELSQPAKIVEPGNFEMENHFYPKVLNAQLHSQVSYLFNLSNAHIISRFCHLNPSVDGQALSELLHYKPRFFPWGGSDLFHVTTANGFKQMVIIETNSCPSGQKSMPLIDEHQEQGGYRIFMEKVFKPRVKAKRNLPKGKLAVVYDKNPMENTGYASAMAEVFDEDVFLVLFHDGDPDPSVRFTEAGVMEVRDEEGRWHPIRAAFRYVTQRPWNRLPMFPKTLILNPTLACLAGGRNKMIAAKAYDFFNAELAGTGLEIKIPETIRDISKREVPFWIKKFGGHAVIKVPYSNAGQGVYTITSRQELDAFMEEEHHYDQFIVQSLIGNYQWSTISSKGRFYHVGTMPNKKLNIYVADLRFMVYYGEGGYRPMAIYARRSRKPLVETLEEGQSSWDMLGTNLSIKREDGGWDSDFNRLRLMDRKEFNTLGIGLDELLRAYIQTVLSLVAIDKMAGNLVTKKGKFRKKLFRSLNNDDALMDEIMD